MTMGDETELSGTGKNWNLEIATKYRRTNETRDKLNIYN
jgi:hypothetical protein